MLIENLILAFVTGVISSFGHCLGMCGGIVAIYSARRTALAGANGARVTWANRIGMLLPVHLGRITTYTILGAMLGLAGALLDQVGGLVGWQGVLSLIVGGVMIAIGLSLAGVLPPIEVALAKITGSPMAQMKGRFGSTDVWSNVALGLLWGLLPCGLVFAMLVNAASTQSLAGGALTMLVFGLGTIPTLLGFGLASNALGAKLRGRLMLVAALIIFFFGAQMIMRGLAAMNILPSLILGPVMLW